MVSFFWRRLAHVYAVFIHVDSRVPGLTSVSWFGTVTLEKESLLQVFKPITFAFKACASGEPCLVFGNSCFVEPLVTTARLFTHVPASVDVSPR